MRPLEPYVQKVLDTLRGVRETPDGWLAQCPSFEHGVDGSDSDPSLRISIGGKGNVLITCRVGCQLDAVLYYSGLQRRDLFPSSTDSPMAPLVPSGAPEDEREDFEERHASFDRVYTYLLRILVLSGSHHQDLRNRGLDDERISQGLYRSITRTDAPNLATACYKEFKDEVVPVPGFYHHNDSTANNLGFSCGVSGLVIPVRDLKSRIVALKIRRPEGVDPKYVYISSASQANGSGPGSPVHCPEGTAFLGSDGERASDEVLRITEGELKADVCCALSPIRTIGIPGIANCYKALGLLESIRATRVLVSYDWKDVVNKPNVRDQLYRFLHSLQAHGYTIGIETWEHYDEYKGIDDALAAGVRPAEHWGDCLDIVKAAGSHQAGSERIQCGEVHQGTARGLSFPTGVFPKALEDFIEIASKALPCPSDFLGVNMLVAAGSAIGATRKLRIKNSWTESANLYAVIIAPPATLKSPAQKIILRPLEKRQEELYDEYKEREKIYKENHRLWKARQKAFSKLLDKHYREKQDLIAQGMHETAEALPIPTNDDPEPALMPMTTVYTKDTTVEALADNLCISQRGIAVICDELAGWLQGFNQYKGGKGPDRQVYLSCWSNDTFKIDRKYNTGKKLVQVIDPCVSVLGGIQPDMLGQLADEKDREDGFIERFLFCMPDFKDANKAIPPLTKEDIPDQAKKAWYSTMVQLWNLRWATNPDTGKELPGVPEYLSFEPLAWEKFLAWHEDDHRQPAIKEGFSPRLQSTWSKLKAYCARLALIIHMLRSRCSPPDLLPSESEWSVSLESLNRAITLTEYFKEHATKVNDNWGYDIYAGKIKDLTRWMEAKGKQSVSIRELQRMRRWGKGISDIEKVLRIMEDRNIGRMSSDAGPAGRRYRTFILTSKDQD